MFIYYGSRLYGTCDQVPGAFTIATVFGHLYFIPLVPKESWLVLPGGDSRQWRGVKLPGLHWRSIGFAWARLGLGATGAIAAFRALAMMGSGDTASLIGTAVLAAASFGGLFWSYRASRASYERALALVREHKLGDHFETVIEASYGRSVIPANF